MEPFFWRSYLMASSASQPYLHAVLVGAALARATLGAGLLLLDVPVAYLPMKLRHGPRALQPVLGPLAAGRLLAKP
ncbi:MAG: hypothetical protein EON58_05625 [Alphaproteobacteria bacterium]|nr:MAG: hypothetical protein EON58_05625 [Alphaproteobacteria bacterium]